MVDEVGLEPTMPLRRKIYSLLGLPIFLHIQNRYTLTTMLPVLHVVRSRECVLKYSKLLSLTVRKEYFNTL